MHCWQRLCCAWERPDPLQAAVMPTVPPGGSVPSGEPPAPPLTVHSTNLYTFPFVPFALSVVESKKPGKSASGAGYVVAGLYGSLFASLSPSKNAFEWQLAASVRSGVAPTGDAGAQVGAGGGGGGGHGVGGAFPGVAGKR